MTSNPSYIPTTPKVVIEKDHRNKDKDPKHRGRKKRHIVKDY